ncbi:protein-export chaperone SecB [Desulfonema ishimotonii]|uniref:Protein-export chaperone SecB n=1 Tax=Desulfonema ishimotonii TaxID=45657 RepID=A0A401FUF0_9BACT|nr:protein-export chaperone SecB [Desulfonema ishimotonii]GBC60568.1 protein-export chaperone SecB [Desulfonema ishimotonii]
MSEKSKFSFVDYRIVKLSFELNKDFEEKSGNIEIDPEISLNYEKIQDVLTLYLGVSVDDPKVPFTFTVVISGVFKFGDDVSGENTDSIANINCAAILFPFLREVVADLTRRAGFPPLLLPPINFVSAYRRKKGSEESIGLA